MGNFNSGYRRDKKTLTSDCTFIDSYKLTTFYPLDLVINKQYKQRVNVTYNEKKRHGGKVKYFECPYCNLRARFLYALNNRIACRTCQNLTYESSQSKNHFYSLAKFVSGMGIDPRLARSFFRNKNHVFWN